MVGIFDKEALLGRLSTAHPKQSAAFATACCARLESTARSLAVHDNVIQLVSLSVDGLVEWLAGDGDTDTLPAEDELLAVMPDEDDYPEWESAVVEDAVGAAIYAIATARDRDIQSAVWAATRAYDTADREALRRLGIEDIVAARKDIIPHHPFVRSEVDRQARDLNAVCHLRGVALADVVRRSRSENILNP